MGKSRVDFRRSFAAFYCLRKKGEQLGAFFPVITGNFFLINEKETDLLNRHPAFLVRYICNFGQVCKPMKTIFDLFEASFVDEELKHDRFWAVSKA